MQKPQILLVGDSIRMGYCETVKADLATDIDVLYPDENCQSSYYILQNLKGWVDITRPENVIAVHFNCGHWDAAHFGGDPDSLSSPDVYAQNILRIARRLRQYFPKAAITAPVTDAVIAANPFLSNVRTVLIRTPLNSFCTTDAYSSPLTCMPARFKHVTRCPEATILVDAACTDSFDKALHEKVLDVLEGFQVKVTGR